MGDLRMEIRSVQMGIAHRDLRRSLWQLFVHGGHDHGHHHHHDFFSPDMVRVLYERYTEGLEGHVDFHFEEHYKITLEFRDVVKIRFGVDHSLLIKALIALAKVCEYSEEHHHEAITLYCIRR